MCLYLRQAGKKRLRRTFGGITGLHDTLLMPPMMVDAESGSTQDQMLITCMRLQAQSGCRPLAICVDDVEHSFLTVSRALQAAFPSQVKLVTGEDNEVTDWVRKGNVLINVSNSKKNMLGRLHCPRPAACFQANGRSHQFLFHGGRISHQSLPSHASFMESRKTRVAYQ